MKSKLFVAVAGLSLAAGFFGCTSVVSVNMLGTGAAAVGNDWEGVWGDGKELVFHVKVKNPEKGILGVAMVGWEKGDFSMRKFDVFIRKGDKHDFCNILYKDMADEKDDAGEDVLNSYFWMLVKQGEGVLLLYMPDAKEIAVLVEEGKLSGEKGDGNILLKGSQEELTKLLEDDGGQTVELERTSGFEKGLGSLKNRDVIAALDPK